MKKVVKEVLLVMEIDHHHDVQYQKKEFHQQEDDHDPPDIVVTSPGGTTRVMDESHSKPSSLEFQFNNAAKNRTRGFPSNVVRTSKYTILTFLPINLFEQFRRLANGEGCEM